MHGYYKNQIDDISLIMFPIEGHFPEMILGCVVLQTTRIQGWGPLNPRSEAEQPFPQVTNSRSILLYGQLYPTKGDIGCSVTLHVPLLEPLSLPWRVTTTIHSSGCYNILVIMLLSYVSWTHITKSHKVVAAREIFRSELRCFHNCALLAFCRETLKRLSEKGDSWWYKASIN